MTWDANGSYIDDHDHNPAVDHPTDLELLVRGYLQRVLHCHEAPKNFCMDELDELHRKIKAEIFRTV